MRVAPRSILIVLHGSIGDVTRALPLATLLRRGFPKVKLSWAVEAPSFPLVEHYPGIDEIIVFDRRHWWRGIGPLLRTVRARQFDVVLDLQRHLKSGVISFFSGAPVRIGFNKADGKEFNWLFNNRFIERASSGRSKISHYMKFAELLGIPSQPIEWQFKLQPDEEKRIATLLDKIDEQYAVLFVGTRWQSKQWLPRQIADCARYLWESHKLEALLLGGKEDRRIADEAVSFYSERVENLVGQTALRDALGLIAQARVAVGPDTGLMHIAAAVGTPVVSLWGATSPARTGPYGFDDLVVQGRAPCVPCYRRRCPIGHLCMKSIAANEIQAKLVSALARTQ